jgi:hypothetical protein
VKHIGIDAVVPVAHVWGSICMRERQSIHCCKDDCTFVSAVAWRLPPLSPFILEPVLYGAPIVGGACWEGHVCRRSKFGSVTVCFSCVFVLSICYCRGENSSSVVLCPSTLLIWAADVCRTRQAVGARGRTRGNLLMCSGIVHCNSCFGSPCLFTRRPLWRTRQL